MDTEGKAKFLQQTLEGYSDLKKKEMDLETKNYLKSLQTSDEQLKFRLKKWEIYLWKIKK